MESSGTKFPYCEESGRGGGGGGSGAGEGNGDPRVMTGTNTPLRGIATHSGQHPLVYYKKITVV